MNEACKSEMYAKANARSNIALIKYWGKRNIPLNLPAVGSISITLDGLRTVSSVRFDPNLKQDQLWINNQPASEKERQRVQSFLDLVRKPQNLNRYAVVHSENNFPTSAGLASSASAFAALALAATRAAGRQYSLRELSILARQGSGSATRSIFGGFAEMQLGEQDDGSDACARQLAPVSHWNLRVLIAITSRQKKKTGSTDGMMLSRETAPYYDAWVSSAPRDLEEMRDAIIKKDFQKLGELSEFSCLKMHGLALSSRPGLIYWNGTTVETMHRVRQLRSEGTEAYFTIDAGPQVKVLCQPDSAEKVKAALMEIQGLDEIMATALGEGVQLMEPEE